MFELYLSLSIDIVHELLRYGAIVKEKNSLGWTPLDESVSYGDRSTSKLIDYVQAHFLSLTFHCNS